MKKILLLCFCGFFPIFCFSQIPNPDFEDWVDSLGVVIPVGWNFTVPRNAKKIDNALEGNYSLQISNNSFFESSSIDNIWTTFPVSEFHDTLHTKVRIDKLPTDMRFEIWVNGTKHVIDQQLSGIQNLSIPVKQLFKESDILIMFWAWGDDGFSGERIKVTIDSLRLSKGISPLIPKDSVSICASDSYFYRDTFLTQPGDHALFYKERDGTDSTHFIHLTVLDTIQTQINFTVKKGNVFKNVEIQSDTIFKRFFTASNGCDSIVTYNLTALPLSVNEIPNADFENWQIDSAGHEDPICWFSFNFGDSSSAIKAKEPILGNHSIRVANSFPGFEGPRFGAALTAFKTTEFFDTLFAKVRIDTLSDGTSASIYLKKSGTGVIIASWTILHDPGRDIFDIALPIKQTELGGIQIEIWNASKSTGSSYGGRVEIVVDSFRLSKGISPLIQKDSAIICLGDSYFYRDTFLSEPGAHALFYPNARGTRDSTHFVHLTILEPESEYTLSDNSICTTEPTTITYTGNAPSTANFNWNFQNATILSGSGAGPYQISYPTAGGYQISLEVEENGCASPLTEQTIVVNDRLAPFFVNCSSTVDEITFSWNPVQGATNYRVNSLTGQTGVLNGTNYVVSGLSPNEEVSLEIFAESGVGCAASSTTKTCTAQDCPPVSVSISPIADICLNQMTAPIQLFVQQNGGSGTGSFTWSGSGITSNGMFDPNASNIGTVQIETRYTEGSCEYFASQIINVFNSPTANFTVDAVVCLGDEVTVTYTGNASSSAIYNWDFGNAIIVSGSGRGPYQILPNLPGTFTISLEVEENGCVSPVESQTIQADEPLFPPIISCNISTTNSLTFGWNDVSGNAGYSVRVLTGQTGILTGTNYEVNGLSSGEEVTIELTVLSSNSCPPQVATLTCVTTNCPPIIVSIDPLQMPICFGDSLQVQLTSTLTNSSGNGIFTWSGTGISSTGLLDVSGLPSGDLPVTLTYEENGCIYSGSTNFTINTEIDLGEKILSPIWYPGNSGSIELTVSGGTPPYVFGWSQFPVSEPAIRDVPPGEYCVTVIDNMGCAALDCYTIGAGIYRTSPIVVMCGGETRKLSVRPSRGADFSWLPSDGLSCTDCASPNTSPSKSTIYSVSAAMPDGRLESMNVAVIVLPPFICNLASAVPGNDFSKILNNYALDKIGQKELFEIENQIVDFLTEKEVNVIPNPTTGLLNISSFSKVEKTEVFDISGRKIFESDESEIDISAFAKGIYFFKIKTEGKTVVKRVVLI